MHLGVGRRSARRPRLTAEPQAHPRRVEQRRGEPSASGEGRELVENLDLHRSPGPQLAGHRRHEPRARIGETAHERCGVAGVAVGPGDGGELGDTSEIAAAHGWTPRARVHTATVTGDDPVLMLTGIIPATAKVLARAGLSLDDIDAFEVNEAFASVVLAWLAETGADPAKVNVNGGAISIGHPLGASGARLATTLVGVLEQTGGRYGLQTMCEAGGTANATIVERIVR